MSNREVKALLLDQRGAIAPTFALTLFALVAVGGISFDYARLAAMDSELQNAADQAALAAASQLDGLDGATERAVDAANNLVSNNTLFANDAAGTGVTIANVVFYESDRTTIVVHDDSSSDDDAAARFVEVTVGARTATYALTPVVGAFNSGAIDAAAMAGLGSSICRVPPVMICNPQETGTNTDFDATALIGAGMRLVSVGANGGWAPGNFGYLNTGGGSNGAPGLREALGWEAPPGDCIAQTGVDTKPGATVSVTDSLNTRFDIYDNVACPSGGNCPASINALKDLLRPGNASGNNACRIHNKGWQQVPSADRYLPTSATSPLATSITPKGMGHPRDMCHAADSGATGFCVGPIGDGNWDRDAYFRSNYGWSGSDWQTNTGLPSTATRYAVYEWEIDNRGSTIGGQVILGERRPYGNATNQLRGYGNPICSGPEGYGSGTVPGTNSVDRRRISVAVVNCTANSVNGAATNVPVEKWIDVFLVEPSLNRSRTSAGDIYVEVISETLAGGSGATAGQVVRRDVPYLVQ